MSTWSWITTWRSWSASPARCPARRPWPRPARPGRSPAAHEAFWAAARARHGDGAGTRALIEVLLLHRRMPAAQVIAGIDRGAGRGQLLPGRGRGRGPQARRCREPGNRPREPAWQAMRPRRSRAAVITLPRRAAELPPDARPAPSVAAYDQLLAPRAREGGA